MQKSFIRVKKKKVRKIQLHVLRASDGRQWQGANMTYDRSKKYLAINKIVSINDFFFIFLGDRDIYLME